MRLRLVNRPERPLDRDQAVAWMKDGHSFVRVVNGNDLPARQPVEIVDGDGVQHVIRADHVKVAEDGLPVG